MSTPAAAAGTTAKVASAALMSQLLPESPEGLAIVLVVVGLIGGFARGTYEPLPIDASTQVWVGRFAKSLSNGVLWAVIAFGCYEMASLFFAPRLTLPTIGGVVVACIASFGQVEVARGVLRFLERLPMMAEQKLTGRKRGDDGD